MRQENLVENVTDLTPKKDNSHLISYILGEENGSKKALHHELRQIILLFERVFIIPCLTYTYTIKFSRKC